MRNSIKRAAVAIAGLAIAGGAALGAAPSADAATVTGRTATIGASAPSSSVAWRGHDDDDDCCYGGDRHEYKRWHYKKRWHHEKRYRWKNYGRYDSYDEAWRIGSRYRNDRWSDFDCRREGGRYVLVVKEIYYANY
ncbi:hypothetical protein [Cryptosporangium phraense]|uniref:Uncharacterized protein n=1 Tax=Cryptosporangium phraense TaxID=2593070 RepID=A0A545AWL9_9ACTN|nr:hypothetical protein [Cryptosporangium phraense]TQS45724.1 hypothetical protein FL583_08400 [Cryptosporangium phraense]